MVVGLIVSWIFTDALFSALRDQWYWEKCVLEVITLVYGVLNVKVWVFIEEVNQDSKGFYLFWWNGSWVNGFLDLKVSKWALKVITLVYVVVSYVKVCIFFIKWIKIQRGSTCFGKMVVGLIVSWIFAVQLSWPVRDQWYWLECVLKVITLVIGSSGTNVWDNKYFR